MPLLFLSLLACPPDREPEDPTGWFDPGAALDVTEPIAFTDEPYAPAGDAPVAALWDGVFPVEDDGTVFAPGDDFGDADCGTAEDTDLPLEIEGVVTVQPRFYFKTRGCEGDEKYYGSFFVQDATGGAFVLGDTKVAHFDVGNTVRLRVRGAKTSFDLDMVYAWDIASVDHTVKPVFYEVATQPLDAGDLYVVKRVTGTVMNDKDTFGAFQIEDDIGTTFDVQIDSELNRRGLEFPVGTRIQVTGPVLYSYSVYSIVVMDKGQVEDLGPS